MDVFVLGSHVHAHSLQVQRLPQRGESIIAETCWSEHGGKGLNLALGLQRLGLQTALLLAVGQDAAGTDLLRCLQAEGMDTGHVVRVEAMSGFGVGLVARDGANSITVYPGANACLTADHVQAASAGLAASRLVCAQFEIPDAPILEAFRRARQQGIRTLLNPSPWRTPAAGLLALTDILVLNEPEAVVLFGIEPVQQATPQDWLQRLPLPGWAGELLVVTLAGQGCVALQRGQAPLHVPAWTVAARDATGAGDAFSAGLACALLHRCGLLAALRFANACGALTVSRSGVRDALPNQVEVRDFMAARAGAASPG